jgi:arylsulfatase A-like enzyme
MTWSERPPRARAAGAQAARARRGWGRAGLARGGLMPGGPVRGGSGRGGWRRAGLARAAGPWTGRALAAVALGGLMLAAAGCGRREPSGFDLRSAVEARRYALDRGGGEGGGRVDGLSFPAAPALRELEVDHERRPVVVTTAAGWSWHGRVPPRARLAAGVQLLPQAWRVVRRLEAIVELREGDRREVLQVGHVDGRGEPRWLDLTADLSRYGGREVTVRVAADLTRLPARWRRSALVAWGPATLAAPPAAAPPRPNILFILVDTLRRDRLTPYGYWRETSPEIARRLAAAGTVAEDAYSQAPWTLPSVVSLMTGRYPGELLGDDLATYGVPTGVETLAERLARLGYETGGFLANPALHVGAGFLRGFRTCHAPTEDEWIRKHADELNRHAAPWLAAYERRPFFLYVHYVDPHDPYENPEIVGNRSPFESPYAGPVAGDWVHGIYSGRIRLADPPRDTAHLGALYDSEVHYADRAIGELLAGISPEVLANTLVVLTADHGEELADHGGWKHGQTLYEEQVHVPLVLRWDRRIPAGRRLRGTVRLVDLVPTLLAAAGAPPDPGAEGIDLLPALTGRAELPARPAFAEGLSGGPLRAAAVAGKLKLVLFNREEPFHPANALQDHLWRLDLSRLRRAELYDLGADPRELRSLWPGGAAGPLTGPAGAAGPGLAAGPDGTIGGPAGAAGPNGAAGADRATAGPDGSAALPALAAEVARLDEVIERRLDLALPGLRIHAAGVPPGSRLAGTVVFERPPARWVPYFLAEGDRVELAGNRLRFDLGGDLIEKGVRVEGDFGGLVAISVALDGQPLPTARIMLGADADGAYGGGAVAAARLRTRRWPAAGALKIWLHDTSGEVARRATADAETERKLRALGYLQ